MADNEKRQDEALAESGVATQKENAKLEHSQGGATTRDDALDAGAPMLPGSPDEPQGPEDAFGRGPKRGDYTERTGGVTSAEAVPTENAGEPVYGQDADGEDVIVDYEPGARLESQVQRTQDIGDEEGKKGGVDTDPLAAP